MRKRRQSQPKTGHRHEARRRLELPASLVDQEVADVGRARVALRLGRCRFGEVESELCDLDFGEAGAPRELFDRVSIAIACLEVDRAVRRVRTQRGVDDRYRFEKLSPVEGGNLTQAGDDVADGDVARGA